MLCGAHRVSEMPAGNPLCVQSRPAGCLGILISDSGSPDWGRMPFSTLVGASISVKETCVGDLQLEGSGEPIHPLEMDEVGSQNSAVSPGLH